MNLGVGMKSKDVDGGSSTTGTSTIKVSGMFFCLGLLMFSLYLAIGGTSTIGARTYMQMPNMNNTCNIYKKMNWLVSGETKYVP